ncbi:hypothetical protein GQX74_010309 [Glossina fuscipes]|nr:hypothetical protein GQX74_010309 [Glossina fuscipes]
MIIKQEDKVIGHVFELHEMQSSQFTFSFVVLPNENFQPITILDSIPLWFLIYMRNLLVYSLDGIFAKLVTVSTLQSATNNDNNNGRVTLILISSAKLALSEKRN